MVKQINVSFDDSDFEKLEKKKGELTWHEFILKLLEIENETKNI